MACRRAKETDFYQALPSVREVLTGDGRQPLSDLRLEPLRLWLAQRDHERYKLLLYLVLITLRYLHFLQ